jgi:hypothetical protein
MDMNILTYPPHLEQVDRMGQKLIFAILAIYICVPFGAAIWKMPDAMSKDAYVTLFTLVIVWGGWAVVKVVMHLVRALELAAVAAYARRDEQQMEYYRTHGVSVSEKLPSFRGCETFADWHKQLTEEEKGKINIEKYKAKFFGYRQAHEASR